MVIEPLAVETSFLRPEAVYCSPDEAVDDLLLIIMRYFYNIDYRISS